MRRFISILLSLFLIFTIVALYIRRWKPEGLDHLETTGIIEATELVLGPKVTGRIEYLCCKEGDEVRKGDVVIRLEDNQLKARLEEGKAILKTARAALRASEVELEDLKAGVEGAREEVKATEAEVKRVQALLEDAKRESDRVSKLFEEGFISKKDRDAAQTIYEATYAQLEATRARKGVAEARLRAVQAGLEAGQARVVASRAKVREASAGLKVLETQLEDVEVKSPIDGVIVYKAFEIGENIPSGASVYTLHDLKNLWARVDIEETDIGRVRIGGKAVVVARGLLEEFSGEVIEVGRVGEFATQRDVTRGRADIRTFRVKVGIKEPMGILKPGMMVKVRVYF